MSSRRLVLASASPARLRLLRDAGFDPEVIPSHVAEDVDEGDVEAAVAVLAARKANAVAVQLSDGLVVGCDSLFELGGIVSGKPADREDAVARWHAMRGTQGRLVTGHCLVDAASGATASEVSSTVVRFGRPTDAEIEAYVATGEPLAVAGGCTLDGRSAPFIEGIDGDPGTVIGLSLPVLWRLLVAIGVDPTTLWTS